MKSLLAAAVLGPELARWRRQGQRPTLWWRDDDAREPTPKLDRLIECAGGRPLGLAVVPDGDLGALAARLAGCARVSVGQHGIDHRNRRPRGQRPSEYTQPPNVEEFARAICEARDPMRAAGLNPAFYTPPWNHVEPGLCEALVQSGFSWLSAARKPPTPCTGLGYLSADVDLLRWNGAPRFKGERRVLAELARAMRTRREAGAWDRPIGILTHHLAQDEATWRFLAWLLPRCDRGADWLELSAVLAAGGAMARSSAVC